MMSLIRKTLDCEGCPSNMDHGNYRYCIEVDAEITGEPEGKCKEKEACQK